MKSLDTSAAFAVTKDGFLLDGQPFQIRSGELHFARIPRPYWRQRLEMAAAMGLNTVCAYLFWNVHEPRPGKFVFDGDADVSAFIRLAGEVGLKVILRPGPYACAEWDFGGLPSWLLATPDIRVRCGDPRFLAAARPYLLKVGQELSGLQITEGGPIVLVQVENEYGSYGDDAEYMAFVRDTLCEAGFDVPLFTCDGPGAFQRGSVTGAFPVANFSDDPERGFASLREFSPATPIACGEYYPGWFDHWGVAHHVRGTDVLLPEVKILLDKAAMFSLYMFHGGTSFGFMAGANTDRDGRYQPQTTSYDYDAPLDEAGRPTAKFFALRDLFASHLGSLETLPPVPGTMPTISLSPISFSSTAALFDNLPARIQDVQPRPMEAYGQDYGLILYRSKLAAGKAAPLTIRELHDYGAIFLDRAPLGTLDRRLEQNRIDVPERIHDCQLDILVEGMGRVNYGPYLLDHKGITERVEFPVPYQAGVVMNWDVFCLPLDAGYLGDLRYSPESTAGPAFHRAEFALDAVGDTFLDMRGWGKGFVWVNGHNLGRFWGIGPAQTLYLPGCYLLEGVNEIVIFDFEAVGLSASVQGLREAILDEVRVRQVV